MNKKIITLDFETFYDQGYTLKTMSTSEYIRDARFRVHCVGIKDGTRKTRCYKGDDVGRAIADIDFKDRSLLCHNTAFDGFILSHHYGVVAGYYLDSLSMARGAFGHGVRHTLDNIARLFGLGGKIPGALAPTKGLIDLPPDVMKKLMDYCAMDVDLTVEIFKGMQDYIPEPEMDLIDLTMRMFCDPCLRIDMPRVARELEKEIDEKLSAVQLSGVDPKVLASAPMFATALKKAGCKVIPMKISPRTGKQTYAFAQTDNGFKALLKHKNAKVRQLALARLKVKSTIGETRAERFLEAGRDKMCLPVLLNYCGAHTNRWSGGNKINLQNLKRGGELRKSILAPKGMQVVVADSAQIEARFVAWLAGQEDILTAFATKQDVYKLMASAIYNKPVEQITKDERFIGKICVLGLGYGMGPDKLKVTLELGTMGPEVFLPREECRRIVQIYRARNKHIVALWRHMDRVLATMMLGKSDTYKCLEIGKGFIRLPNGLFLQYPDMHADYSESPFGDVVAKDVSYRRANGRAKIYGGSLTENVVQALARIAIAEQMLEIKKLGYRIVTMTHDEIVCVVPTKQAKKCLADMLRIMSTPPSWAPTVPLAAEGGFDVNYSK